MSTWAISHFYLYYETILKNKVSFWIPVGITKNIRNKHTSNEILATERSASREER